MPSSLPSGRQRSIGKTFRLEARVELLLRRVMPVALSSPCRRFACVLFLSSAYLQAAGAEFNVRDYGATGNKAENAKQSIQRAIDACAAAGGGTVLLPAGSYSSGTLHLRSHVRLYLDSGATLYSIKDKSAFDQDSLIFADGAENITVEGRGTIDGQGAYEWRLNDFEDDYIRPNLEQMQAAGKPPLRAFPKKDQFGKLFLLLRCHDVRIAGLNRSIRRSWTIHPYACERLGHRRRLHPYQPDSEAVWADGIDPDGCKDVRIANCTIETGDDAIVFYSDELVRPAASLREHHRHQLPADLVLQRH